MNAKLDYRISIRLFDGEERCFGPGVARLLRQVEALGSLRKAAASMGMAYSKAWHIYKRAEQGLGMPLLTTDIGGSGGGGAKLTKEALQLLAAYDAFCLRLEDSARSAFKELFPSC